MDVRTIEADDDDAKNYVLPTDDIPVVEPLDPDDRNDVFDSKKMEDQLSLYQTKAEEMVELFNAWAIVHDGWGSRFDRVYGKADYIDRTLLVLLGKEPGDSYEPFEILDLGVLVTSGVAFVTGMVGMVSSYRSLKALEDGARWFGAKGKATGGMLLSVASFGFGAYVAIENTRRRTEALKAAMVDYNRWFNETKGQIEEMKQFVEVEVLPRLREAARTLGIVEEDDNVMFRRLLAQLNIAVSDVAEVEAQLRVATRMICQGTGTFTDQQVSDATGLPLIVVANRRVEAEAQGSTLCVPYTT
jgi:hypothetical protein